jgi:hypothetical protein
MRADISTKVFPLDQANRALNALKNGAHSRRGGVAAR